MFPFWKLLVSDFLFGISETLHCSMSAPHLKIVPLLDVHQLLILFAETLTYSGPGTFCSVVLYNMVQFLLLLFARTRTKIELKYYYYYYVLTLFSRLLMLTLAFLEIIINLLSLYRPSYFVFFLLIIFVYFYVLVLTL
jgi:hypothetical protein